MKFPIFPAIFLCLTLQMTPEVRKKNNPQLQIIWMLNSSIALVASEPFGTVVFHTRKPQKSPKERQMTCNKEAKEPPEHRVQNKPLCHPFILVGEKGILIGLYPWLIYIIPIQLGSISFPLLQQITTGLCWHVLCGRVVWRCISWSLRAPELELQW